MDGATRDHDLSELGAEQVDRDFHAALGQITRGLSPTAMGLAWLDWAMHLAGSPAKQLDLGMRAIKAETELARDAVDCVLSQEERAGLSADSRFSAPQWQRFPFNLWAETFLKSEAWWNTATTGLHGVDPHHAQVVNFGARQWLDTMSPSNFAATNPVVLQKTLEENGGNLMRGFRQWLADLAEGGSGAATGFEVGRDVATTSGDVILRNRLIELIRYRPVTGQVRARPLLIVPAWIMKYYILDLSPQNSLVSFLLAQGFEVYMISWKNPGAEDADLSMQDYIDLGIRAALDAIGRHVPGEKIHAAGYCLGGTLLAMTAAAMARDGDERLASLTFLAAQVDFSEPGEIALFIDESQVAFLEDIMSRQGYLEADQMSGAFRMLRSTDLVWGKMVRAYLMGESGRMNDLMAWNADSTRMPATMHSEYLRHLFLQNALALGFFDVDDRHVSLNDITLPAFVVGTEADHVAPWKSVWKFGRLTDGPVTFALTNGGHNAGILSEPGHRHRHFRLSELTDPYQDPEDWFEAASPSDGSWWPAWAEWLQSLSPEQRTPVAPEAPLSAAPGEYVLKR